MDHRSYNPLTLPKLKIQIRTHLMPTLSIVIPTFNEQDNVRQVYQAVAAALIDRDLEIIFVDDASQDATTREVMALNREDLRVRLIRRIGRRGLSSACIEGMLASTRGRAGAILVLPRVNLAVYQQSAIGDRLLRHLT